MKIIEFKSALLEAPDKTVRFTLPNGVSIPPHFHICELAHIHRVYLDCCGSEGSESAVTLQAIAGKRPYDENQSMSAGKLAKILHSAVKLMADPEIPVEIEFGEPYRSRFPIESLSQTAHELLFQLHARNEECSIKKECEAAPEAPCYCHVAGCC